MKLDQAQAKPRSAERTSLAPWLILLFVGSAGLGLFFLLRPALGYTQYYRPGPLRTTYEYNRPILLLFIPYALALLAWRRGARAPLWLLLAGAIVLHVLVLFAPLPQSQDFYQYLFYGRMQAAHGANPYVVQPVAFNTDLWYGWIRWRYQTSVYGPVWSLVSLGVVKSAGESLRLGFALMKLAVLSMDVGVMALIVREARTRKSPADPGWGILAYAWNPLILITVPIGGFADVAIAVAFLGALLARRRGRTGLATVLLALASLVKIYALAALVLHLVLVARERRAGAAARHAGLALGIAAVAYAPYWAGWKTFHGVIEVADMSNRSFTGTIQRLLIPAFRGLGFAAPYHEAGIVVRWVAGLLLAAVLVVAIRRTRNDRALWTGTLLVLSTYLLLTPWFLYWYLVAPIALVAAIPEDRLTYPVLTFSGTSLITVWFSPPYIASQTVQMVLRYLPPAAVYRRKPRLRRVRGGAAVPVPPRATAPIAHGAPAAK